MRSTIGWPPSSNTPASNETRVRVDGASKISATVAPDSACEDSGERLSSAARASSASSSTGVSSAPVRKWRVKRSSVRSDDRDAVASADLERDARPRTAALGTATSAREFTAALDGWDWDVALLQEVPPWWPARARRRR